MPESSWVMEMPPDGLGAYATPVVKRNFTSVSGTTVTLNAGDTGSTKDINVAMFIAFRAWLNARSAGTITSLHTVHLILTNDGSGNFTPSCKYGGSITGGTTVTQPTYKKTTLLMPSEAYQRTKRAVRNDRSAGN